MSEAGKHIAQALTSYEPPDWDRFPDMDLYMDQLLSVLGSFSIPTNSSGVNRENGSNSLLTANMVNNYVKEGFVPRPEGRRYDRERIALLYMLTVLKPVLSIPDAARELHVLQDEQGSQEVSSLFADGEAAACKRAADLIALTDPDGSLGDAALALRLAVEANILRQCAQKLIDGLPTAMTKN